MPQYANGAVSKPSHHRALSLHFTPPQLLCSSAAPSLLPPFRIHCKSGEMCRLTLWLQGKTFSADLSLTSRWFCPDTWHRGFLVSLVFFFPTEWKIFTRRCGDHASAHPGVCSLHSRTSASPFGWERATEGMEIGQDIDRNQWRLKGDLPNPKGH